MTGMFGQRYQVLESLGSGGMADVFRARDQRLMRDVAVKVLRNLPQDQELGLFYFHREARAVAALHHPNIVQIYDYSGPDETPAYLVTEFVDGGTVDDLLVTQHPLPESVVVAVTLAVTAALGHAHHHGVLHRDVKPANVLVDYEGRVVLADFGAAKGYRDATLVTDVGQPTAIFGTLDFMSPEQLRDEEVSPATDVFALGALAYCLATQYSPFHGNSQAEIADKVEAVDFIPLSERRNDLSLTLCRVVAGCLQRKPEARPTTDEILRVLTAHLSVLGVEHPNALIRAHLSPPGRVVSAVPDALDSDNSSKLDAPRTAATGHSTTYSSAEEATAVMVSPPSAHATTRAQARGWWRQPEVWPWLIGVVFLLGIGAVVWGGRQPRLPTDTTSQAAVVTPHNRASGLAPSPAGPDGAPSKRDLEERPQWWRGNSANPDARAPSARMPTPGDLEPSEEPQPFDPMATLLMQVLPRGVVYINGHKEGDTRAFRVARVPPGTHHIEVRHPTLGHLEQTVVLHEGEQRTLSFIFDERSVASERIEP